MFAKEKGEKNGKFLVIIVSYIYVSRNGVDTHFWETRNGADTQFWLTRIGLDTWIWETTNFQFSPSFSPLPSPKTILTIFLVILRYNLKTYYLLVRYGRIALI